VGEEVPVEVLRGGETVELAVTLGRREEAEGAVPASVEGSGDAAETELFGLTLSEMTPELRQQLDLPESAEGLVVTDVDPASNAAEKGVVAGDVITEAGQQKVTSVADFEARVEEARDAGRRSLLLLVRRGGDPRFVALGLEEGE
jgi:serine protease Do